MASEFGTRKNDNGAQSRLVRLSGFMPGQESRRVIEVALPVQRLVCDEDDSDQEILELIEDFSANRFGEDDPIATRDGEALAMLEHIDDFVELRQNA